MEDETHLLIGRECILNTKAPGICHRCLGEFPAMVDARAVYLGQTEDKLFGVTMDHFRLIEPFRHKCGGIMCEVFFKAEHIYDHQPR